MGQIARTLATRTELTAMPMPTPALSSRVTPKNGQMPKNRLRRKLFTSAEPTKSKRSSLMPSRPFHRRPSRLQYPRRERPSAFSIRAAAKG